MALNNVDLRIESREIVGLIGPNGSGKTTLFNVLCGFYSPDHGRVFYRNRDITKLPPSSRNRLGIARTFQVVKPFSTMTVFENVKAAAVFSNRVHSDIESHCEDVLSFTGLIDVKNVLASQLTPNFVKRMELARALASDPELLLLDEVFAGLNPTEIDQSLGLVRHLAQEGMGILMVEHQMRAIMSSCSRIIVLMSGEKIAEGPAENVSRDPSVIAAYLGRKFAAREAAS